MVNPTGSIKPRQRSARSAWIYIDMLAPEAFGAVIGIAIALHGDATIPASKVFNVPLEFFAHLDYRAKAIGVRHPQ